MKRITESIPLKKILSQTNSLRITSSQTFSNSKNTFYKGDMESKDFLEFLHIPKTQEDIQNQLETLGNPKI